MQHLDPEYLKDVCRNRPNRRLCDVAVAAYGNGGVATIVTGNARKHFVVVSIKLEVRVPKGICDKLIRDSREPHEFFRCTDSRRILEKNSVNQSEDGAIGTNTKCEYDDGEHGERWTLTQRTQSVVKILAEVTKHRSALPTLEIG